MRPIHPGRIVTRGSVATLLAVLAGSGLGGCARDAVMQAAARPLPTVSVVEARRMDVPNIVNRQGTTRAINSVTIRARVKGFLKEQHFKEGDDVKVDQLLLVIDEEQFRIKLDQAKASLAEAEAALKKADDSKAREVAEAQLHLDQAQLTLDQVEEKRERTLLSRNASAIEDVERRQAILKKSIAQVEADQASLQQARADYDTNVLTARAKVEEARANVSDARVNLGYCRMYAPIDGRIGELLTKLGNLVGPDQNTELATIQQLDPMGVDLNPPASLLPAITEMVKNGLRINLKVEGVREYPEQAEVYFMDNMVEPTTGTFLMKAKVPNPDKSLLPGEYTQIRADVGEYVGVIVVPEQAVLSGQAGQTVYVVGTDNKVAVVAVKPINTYRGMSVIEPPKESGLLPGQKVIVEGLQLVRAGQEVKVEEVPLDRYFRDEADASGYSPYESPTFRPRKATGGAPAGDGPEPPGEKSAAEPR